MSDELQVPPGSPLSIGASAADVVDFGVLLQDKRGSILKKGTGVVWKITREGA